MENPVTSATRIQSSTPPTTDHSSLNTILIALLVLVCMFFIGLGGFYLYNRSLQTKITAQNLQRQSAIATETAQAEPQVTTHAEEWNSYADTNFGFTIKYPLEYTLDYLETQPYLNRRITWHASAASIKNQLVDGPQIISEVPSNSPLGATRFVLDFPASEGVVPHEEIWYEIANPRLTSDSDAYLVFRLSSVPINMTTTEQTAFSLQTVTVKLKPEDISVFDQVMESVKFD